MWKIASLSHKRSLQKVLFLEGIFFDKETDDIEPVSRNEFLFARCLNPMNYGEKENGQTLNFEDLSIFAPPMVEMLNLWNDFRKVVDFIDENWDWLSRLVKL